MVDKEISLKKLTLVSLKHLLILLFFQMSHPVLLYPMWNAVLQQNVFEDSKFWFNPSTVLDQLCLCMLPRAVCVT